MEKGMVVKREAKASAKLLSFLTVCFAFLLAFACAAFAAESSTAKNPNATFFPRTGSGQTTREIFKEGVYRRFADDSMITYLVVMHKKGVLAGDPFERTYIGIESVQRNHPGGKPDGSVFLAARLRSPKEIKLSGLQDSPPVINDNEIPFLLDYGETIRNGQKGMLKNQPKMYIMLPAGEGRINIIGGPESLPAPIMGHYIPVTDRPAPLVLQQAMLKCMLEDFIPAATNMLSTSQFYDYKIEFKTGDRPPVDCWAGWYQVTVREDKNMKDYDSRYQMNFIVGDTGNEIKLLTLYDGKMWPVFEDERLKGKTTRERVVVPKG
jgi:hypothetical protein